MTTTAQMTARNYSHGEAVTPSDVAAVNFDALWVGGLGNLALILQDDSAAVTLVAVAAGTFLAMRVRQVSLTGTTATLIVGLRA